MSLLAEQPKVMLEDLPYLENVTLYLRNAGSVEDDREQSNTAESCSLGATIHIVLVSLNRTAGSTPTKPEPRAYRPERCKSRNIHGI